MRRHSLDPESIRKQIISVFTISSRKRQSLTNNNQHNHGIFSFARRTRRYSVPDKNHIDISNNDAELRPIKEVSTLIFISACFFTCLLALLSYLHIVNTAVFEINCQY
ncbi:unnamed protein product [Rotaria magnacalcarata]|uniref:Uncharacterized protein n=2 Tax=Rotaria magnacalcarata TaxID=392030 RepID=A0A819JXD8_9BILA|nr:unnamed protein product [Rotaria magnacalcarata]CAF1649609.1 unnamed protein product [Rotaria magnacalcarata]CAF2230602.1 unnamed protein product [Rotaria magnacalcarata]CAF3936606.1 unnamed protein product [Rotaria magnacalcarata]CAF3992293.1 unnamed protein product [Rotaria magnacalcarata]